MKTGDNKNREITNIYKAVLDPVDKTIVKHVIPHSQSQYGQNKTVVTDCLNGRTGFSPGVTVPCVDGKQTWTGYYFPGLLTDTSKITFDTSIKGKFKVIASLADWPLQWSNACTFIMLMFGLRGRFLLTCTLDAWALHHQRWTMLTPCLRCPMVCVCVCVCVCLNVLGGTVGVLRCLIQECS